MVTMPRQDKSIPKKSLVPQPKYQGGHEDHKRDGSTIQSFCLLHRPKKLHTSHSLLSKTDGIVYGHVHHGILLQECRMYKTPF